jgi:hypothetical protein
MLSLPAWPKIALTGKTSMLTQPACQTASSSETSPLTLSDHLITLAEKADRAGYIGTARRLITLACNVFDETPSLPH